MRYDPYNGPLASRVDAQLSSGTITSSYLFGNSCVAYIVQINLTEAIPLQVKSQPILAKMKSGFGYGYMDVDCILKTHFPDLRSHLPSDSVLLPL